MDNSNCLQKIPYHQCGIALRNEANGKVEVSKFTSLGEDKWQKQLEGMTHEQYMIKNRAVSVPLEEDCFFKMITHLKQEDNRVLSRLGILHSRYSSSKTSIKDSLAHPHMDEKNRVAIFHNGFIANYEDLQK